MSDKSKVCIVRYGNVWLQTDDIATKIDWVNERAEASLHTRQWAENFKERMRLEHKTVSVYTLADAMEEARKRCQQNLRSAYFYALQAEVHRLAPDVDFHIKGVGCAAYCFHVDGNFANGVPAVKAARAFLKEYKASNPKKFKKVRKAAK